MESIEKKKIKWKKGTFEGEVKDEKPHGVGKWKSDDGNITIEGEWKDSRLDGKAVEKWNGNRKEYEAKDGKYNGKCIQYYNDGSRW